MPHQDKLVSYHFRIVIFVTINLIKTPNYSVRFKNITIKNVYFVSSGELGRSLLSVK